MAIHIPGEFREFLKLLDAHDVEYLLIGGYAVAFHGYPRATADMDVFINASPENAVRVEAVLRKFGFDVPELSPDLFVKDTSKIIRMGIPPLRIEILMSISGVNFAECYKSRVEFKDDDLTIKIIDLDNLIKNKETAARHKDLDDLEHLQ
ncbi:MAG TPA: hypothetical protein PK200_07290 [Spirochaetota bacterium]|nr:hypothetical protein [Spirochaetota bacterium]HQO04002.1 hypothetical protein [Spirochaetota bacterium]HQP48238.1 hypothetical protein [Spirochaetota bacterium]